MKKNFFTYYKKIKKKLYTTFNICFYYNLFIKLIQKIDLNNFFKAF